VQFQGMIAAYERAQIAERSRRGKRCKAQQGVVNVLSGAPYGYHYVKKSDASAAYYQMVEAEAELSCVFIFQSQIGIPPRRQDQCRRTETFGDERGGLRLKRISPKTAGEFQEWRVVNKKVGPRCCSFIWLNQVASWIRDPRAGRQSDRLL
jgi:hypothetical protein